MTDKEHEGRLGVRVHVEPSRGLWSMEKCPASFTPAVTRIYVLRDLLHTTCELTGEPAQGWCSFLPGSLYSGKVWRAVSSLGLPHKQIVQQGFVCKWFMTAE